jgi:hypothetical protein
MNFLITAPFQYTSSDFNETKIKCEDRVYSDIKNDLLPDSLKSIHTISQYFIQKLEISIDEKFDISALINHVSFFDNNIGIISYNIEIIPLDFSITDNLSNEISDHILNTLIELQAFKDISVDKCLWSGRVFIADYENKHDLSKWLGIDSTKELPEYLVSSGNNFFPSFYCTEDIIRSYTYAQVIYSRNYLLSSKLKEALTIQDKQYLLKLIDERDDCDTLIKESKIGIQAQRKIWIFEWLHQWDIDSLRELNDHRITIINEKINRYYRRKNLKYNKIQSFVFSLIASITLVDLSLNLLNISKDKNFNNTDNFYGVLDFIESQSADLVVLLSIIIACFISILTLKGDKN